MTDNKIKIIKKICTTRSFFSSSLAADTPDLKFFDKVFTVDSTEVKNRRCPLLIMLRTTMGT